MAHEDEHSVKHFDWDTALRMYGARIAAKMAREFGIGLGITKTPHPLPGTGQGDKFAPADPNDYVRNPDEHVE